MCYMGKLLAFSAIVMAWSVTAHAEIKTVVSAILFDKGTGIEMVSDHGLGMSNMKMQSNMGIKLSTDTVPAGEVVFKVKNGSKELTHEMLVFKYVEGQQFPYDERKAKIDEDAAGSLGEVSETEPSKGGELKISLKPGKYVVLCNIPGHFANGMWALLTVQ